MGNIEEVKPVETKAFDGNVNELSSDNKDDTEKPSQTMNGEGDTLEGVGPPDASVLKILGGERNRFGVGQQAGFLAEMAIMVLESQASVGRFPHQAFDTYVKNTSGRQREPDTSRLEAVFQTLLEVLATRARRPDQDEQLEKIRLATDAMGIQLDQGLFEQARNPVDSEAALVERLEASEAALLRRLKSVESSCFGSSRGPLFPK
ncbi:hypothetical protein ACFL6C_00750 [Myxococcota bacterium]